MIGVSDSTGVLTVGYVKEHGARAKFRIADDISSAIGQRRWDLVHSLSRVRLRLLRLELSGYLDRLPQDRADGDWPTRQA